MMSVEMMEFAKLRAMGVIHASMVYVPRCQKSANFSLLRANVPINVPTGQRTKFSTWHVNVQRCVKILTWRANVLKGVQFFQLRLSKGVPIFQYFSKELCCFIYLINLYLIYFIYFVYFKYIPNTYFLYEYIFYLT